MPTGRKDRHVRVQLWVTLRLPTHYSDREIDELLRRQNLFCPVLTGPATFKAAECFDWETIKRIPE